MKSSLLAAITILVLAASGAVLEEVTRLVVNRGVNDTSVDGEEARIYSSIGGVFRLILRASSQDLKILVLAQADNVRASLEDEDLKIHFRGVGCGEEMVSRSYAGRVDVTPIALAYLGLDCQEGVGVTVWVDLSLAENSLLAGRRIISLTIAFQDAEAILLMARHAGEGDEVNGVEDLDSPRPVGSGGEDEDRVLWAGVIAASLLLAALLLVVDVKVLGAGRACR